MRCVVCFLVEFGHRAEWILMPEEEDVSNISREMT